MSMLHAASSRLSAFRHIRLALAAALLSLLAACQAPSTPQGPGPFEGFALTEITVDYSRLDQPLLVSELEGEINRAVSGPSALDALGTRLGLANRDAKQAALAQAINAHITPQVRDQLTPLFKGTRPARAEVLIYSVFLRSPLSLQQLTGTEVTINGVRRPDNPQLRAGLRIVDIQTGETLRQLPPITKIDDGTVMIVGGGPKPPEYGASRRLNKLAFEFAREAAFQLTRSSTVPGLSPENREILGLPPVGPNSTVLWSSQTVE